MVYEKLIGVMMMFQDLKTAIAVIEKRCNRSHGLQPLRTFMDDLGNPQDQINIIHVAGTNGKGSTVNDIRSILQVAGYRVGTFTSPFLEKHQDRIRINDAFIHDDELLAYMNAHFDRWCELELSMFEIDTAIAFLYCFDHQVDYMVLETGLGGLLDSTNIIEKPLISVVTNIGMDHMAILGNSYTAIASQKAGIIKAHSLFVTAEEKNECCDIFKAICKQQQTIYHHIKSSSHVVLSDGHIHFNYGQYQDIILYGPARYQVNNAALAIETIQILAEAGFVRVSEEQLREGLLIANWKGRFEVVQHHPTVILDGAHNPQGITALCASLEGYDNIHFLFTALRDKESNDMIQQLLAVSDDVTLTTFAFYRASAVEELGVALPVKRIADYQKAIEIGLQKSGTFVITGSLYFISEVRAYLERRKESLLNE